MHAANRRTKEQLANQSTSVARRCHHLPENILRVRALGSLAVEGEVVHEGYKALNTTTPISWLAYRGVAVFNTLPAEAIDATAPATKAQIIHSQVMMAAV